MTEMFLFFDLVRNARPGSTFTVLDSGNAEQSEALARKLGFGPDQVRVRAARPEQVPAELCGHDLGLILISGDFSLSASSPTKLGEYLACGLAVVAEESIGDSNDILVAEKVGCLVSSSRRESWMAAVNRALELCDDPEIRQKAADVARRRYSLADGIRLYGNAYRHAAGM